MEKFFLIFMILTFCLVSSASAAEVPGASLEEMVRELQSQIAALQKTVEGQNTKISDLENQVKGKEVLAVQAPEIKAAVKEELPSWMEDLNFYGDLRLRMENIDYAENEQLTGERDRNRFRYQLRFGWVKKVTDELSWGFQLASGDTAAPTSTNATLDTSFDRKNIYIDKAYVTYQPAFNEWVEGLEITGGKFKNPLTTTDIIWDSDVNPEGIYEKYERKFLEDDLKLYGILAQWIIEEDSVRAPGDAELFAYQLGGEYTVTDDFLSDKPLKVGVASSYYDWTDYNRAGAFQGAAGNSTTFAGDLGAEDFDVVDLLPYVKFTVMDKYPVELFGHLAKNIDESMEVGPRANLAFKPDQNYAYNYGIKIGKLTNPKDWQLMCRYSHIEPNATPGYFADSDFGGANRRGFETVAKYRLRKNLDLAFEANVSNNVSGQDSEYRQFHSDIQFQF